MFPTACSAGLGGCDLMGVMRLVSDAPADQAIWGFNRGMSFDLGRVFIHLSHLALDRRSCFGKCLY